MCIFCASIPATAALGAKLSADQLAQPEEKRKPIDRITTVLVALLALGSVVYHSLRWPS